MRIMLYNKESIFKLFIILLRRDLKLRYAGASLGKLWNIFHPLFLFTIYTLVFGYFLRFKTRLFGKDVDFLPFFFAGFWPWISFNEGVVRSASILMEYSSVIKRTKFPSYILVPIAVTSSLIPIFIGFSSLLFLLFIKKDLPFLKEGLFVFLFKLVLLVFSLLIQYIFTLGIGFFVCIMSAFIRDIQQFLGSILNLWFFLSPVFYSLDMLPYWLKEILEKNPWSIILRWYRQIFLSSTIHICLSDIWVLIITVLIFILGVQTYLKGSRYLVDII